MTIYKIIIFAKAKISTQDKDGNWFDIIRVKFWVPGLNYKGAVKIKAEEETEDTWKKLKKKIKAKIINHLKTTFRAIEYEEEI